MDCYEEALAAGISQIEIDRIKQEVTNGASPEKATNTSYSRVKTTIDTQKEKVSTASKIQSEIDPKSKRTVSEQIEDRLVPEAGKGNTMLNVESTKKSILDSILYKHHDTLNKFRNKLFGNKPSKNLLNRMVKQMFGEIDDQEAKQALKEFEQISTASNDLYTKSGGEAKPFKPQIQNNQERILQDDFNTFYTNTKDLVNNSEEQLNALYNKAQKGDDISDDVLDFKSADDYLKYASKYGSNLWSSFMNQLQKQATDTAMNKVFGPNSKSTINKLMKDNNLNKAEQERIIALQDALMGNLNIPINAKLSQYAKGARSLATASMLGGAVLSAVGDIATMLITAKFNNLPATKTMMKGLQGLFKIEDNKQLLAQLGFITDDLIQGLRSQNRFDPNAAGTDMLSMSADKVLRASGLMTWTTGLKNSWKLSHLANLANQTQQYKTIPKKMQKQMKAYGITQKDWTEMRQQNKTMLDVTQLSDNLSYKMRQYINEESNYAVLEPGASNQAYMALGTHAGTLKGEAVRSAAQFKSFMVAGVLTHLSRIWKLDSVKDKATYGIQMTMMGTMVGMLVLGLKDIKNGNDPTSRDYTDPKNYAEALFASGMMGPLEELTKTDFGQSPFDVFGVAGAPVISMLSKPGRALLSDKDLEEKLGDVSRAVVSMVPGRNLLYTQWATDMIARDMLLMVNPEYQEKFNQIDRAKQARDKKSGLENINFF